MYVAMSFDLLVFKKQFLITMTSHIVLNPSPTTVPFLLYMNFILFYFVFGIRYILGCQVAAYGYFSRKINVILIFSFIIYH
jgi:hypothetical protein